MNRFFLLVLAVLAMLSVPALSQADILVGIDRDLTGEWESVGEAFEQEFNVSVWFQGYSQNSMAQQIVLQSFAKSGRLNFIMVPRSWGSTLARYLIDLSDLEQSLRNRGVGIVTINQQPLGIDIPFAPDWFLAMLSWPDEFDATLEFLGFVGSGGAQSAGTQIGSPSSPPQATVASFSTEKIARGDHNPRIDGSLEALIGAAQAALNSVAGQMATAIPSIARTALESLAQLYGVPFSAAGSTVTVVLESQPGRNASNVAALSRLGVQQSSIESTSTLIKITVPLADLASLASQLTGVAFIRPPYTPYALGTPSQGTAAIGADAFHSAGIRGAGTKVAVIDLGFSGLAQAQARGDLPYTVIQNDLSGTGLTSGISHGTAVAEIVYDIAPDAQLYLIKIADEVDLDLAVTYCISQGIDIINHSLGWYNTNFYDGTGTIASIAQRAITGGILWVNAAGNEAQSHWEGTFTDGNSDGWNDQNVTFYASAGSQMVLFLTWNQWPQASTDYDLYLFDPSSNLVASSTKHQTGTEEPTESIQVSASTSGTYTIRIQGTGSHALELFNLYQTVSPVIAASSILAPANVANVVAVGALGHSVYTTGPIEPYSSQGPSNDGRSKPDLVAPDNVTTGTSPYTTFPGTSGAAPHVSGAAALLLSQTPGLSESALRAKLLTQVIPMGSINVYGSGRLSLQAPAGANLSPTASFSYSPSLPVAGSTVSFNASASSDADGSIVQYAWDFTGDGITDATGVVQARSFSAGSYSIRLTVTDDDGATNTQIQSLVVSSTPNSPPNAVLSVSPSSGQPGTWFTFSASGSNDPDGSIVSYAWSFGDGGTSAGLTAYNSYASAGTYTVALTVTDDDGATDIATQVVSVQTASAPDLVAQSIGFAPTNPTVGQSVTFSITVRNQGNSSAGFFRIRLAGTSSSTQTYITQLAAGPSQIVTLALPLTSPSETFTATVDDLNQVSESSETNNTNAVLVTAATIPLVADAGGPYSGTVGSSIPFNGSASTGTITTYLWSFGDGGSAQGATPSHTYASAGTYTVTLTTYSSGGQQSVDVTQAVISTAAPALTAQLYLPQGSYQIGEGLVITYTINRAAYVYLADVTSDGHVTLLFPSWFESTPLVTAGTHTVPGSGTYSLQVSEPAGTETLYLFAASGPISGFPTSFSYGFPLLSTNPSSFRNAILATMQAQFSSGNWVFDTLSFGVVSPAPTTGTIRVLSNPTNALVKIDGTSVGYTTHEQPNVAPGTHTVEVSKSGYQTVTQQTSVVAGGTSTVSVTLTPIPTNNPPVANFSFSPTGPTVGDVVSFDASASYDPDGSISSYAWAFGDGAIGSGQFSTHTFAASGTYSATLTVTDNGGAQGTLSKTVIVGTSEDIGWVSPTSFEDPASNWVVEERAYDDDDWRNFNGAAGHYSSAAGEWTSYLVLNTPEGGLQSDRIRVLVGDSAPGRNLLAWSIDVYRDDAWVNVYTGTQGSLSEHSPDGDGHQWVEIAFDQGLVTRMRLRAYNHNFAGTTLARVWEADFHDATGP
ncbi:PKD domain-containing protein [Candidatus Bipolaricaulota bacterium]|nr:PKD domain-containing protein [Candidatus Bipolaricaulota bacterium]